MISGLYAALLIVIQKVLILRVVHVRRSKKVSVGDGGHEDLTRRIRAHGNFIETVPMALLLMLIAELSGSPLWCIHILGLMLIGARISHVIGISSSTGHGKFRFYGMVVTMTVFGLGALLNLLLVLPTLIGA